MPLKLDSNTSSLLCTSCCLRRRRRGRKVSILGTLVAPVAIGVVTSDPLRVLADVGTLGTGFRTRGNRQLPFQARRCRQEGVGRRHQLAARKRNGSSVEAVSVEVGQESRVGSVAQRVRLLRLLRVLHDTRMPHCAA